MSQKIQLERDCTEKCKSLQHGDLISSVITKRQVSDEELCAYIRWLCSTCGQVCDSMGRTALHFAASCGRTKLAKWLIQNKGAVMNARDLESGYTALHRSIFYGKINVAVALIKLGANIHQTDHNDLTPLEHAMKDKMSDMYSSVNNQIYVWGTNTNYTLGTGSQHSRQFPELNDAFHKNYPHKSVRQICLEKFHCVILAEEEYCVAYACGHGQGGRLGLNTEKTILVPRRIHFPKHRGELFNCAAASIARDHSMFLSSLGTVMTCGLNTHHVLGVKPPPKRLLVPTLVPLHNQAAKGVCAGRYHSVAWGPAFLYTWGLHAGQLGHPLTNNTSIISPKLVTHLNSSDEIVSVAVSDGATVVGTKKGDIFALHEYQCRKIASRQLNIDKIVVIGGHLNPKVCSDLLIEKGGKELKVVVLLTSGNLLIWQESWPQISRCIFNLNRPLITVDVVLSRTELYFVTKDGEAFRADFRTRRKKQVESNEKKSAFHEFLDKDDCQIINVCKFPHIHRAVKIECDLKGRNFACIQNAPQIYTLDGEKFSSSTLQTDMLNLFNNAEQMDNIHDGIFQVSGEIFPVHKYIIAIKSDALFSLLEVNKDAIVEISNMHPYVFKQILTYIYTSTCDFIQIGNLSSEIIQFCANYKNNNETKIDIIDDKKQKNKNNLNISNPLAILQQAAKRFGIKCLSKTIDKLNYNNGKIRPKNDAYYFENYFQLEFDRLLYPNLFDVIIKSENGEEIHAHKCILARLEYFNNLFAVRWNEDSSKSTVSLPVSMKTLEAVVEFLYTDNVLKDAHDLDHLCNVLVICDQLFIENLKEICEKYLSDLLTLRNVAQMLQFSYVYNAFVLKYNCMNFINYNLAAILELRSLEMLDDEILNDLTKIYCYKDVLSKRVITPYSNAPTDEEVKSIFEMFPVNLEDLDQENYEKKISKLGIRKKNRTRKSSNTDNRNKSLSESFESNHSFTEELDMEVVDKTRIDNKPDEKWIKILTDKEKHQKIVQNRLKAINCAKTELESEKHNPDENLTKLISTQSMTSPVQSPKNQTIKSPTINDVPIQKVQKLSQKQRKKIAAELSVSSMAHDLDKINKKPSWNSIIWSKENNSFSDIIKNEKIQEFPELSVGSSSPKNPWQKIETPSPIASPETKQNFKDIVADEKKLKENWTKMRDRPLIYIQMEDKAISDLEKFYNIEQVSDEYITIHKVEKDCFAVPLWVQTNKH